MAGERARWNRRSWGGNSPARQRVASADDEGIVVAVVVAGAGAGSINHQGPHGQTQSGGREKAAGHGKKRKMEVEANELGSQKLLLLLRPLLCSTYSCHGELHHVTGSLMFSVRWFSGSMSLSLLRYARYSFNL